MSSLTIPFVSEDSRCSSPSTITSVPPDATLLLDGATAVVVEPTPAESPSARPAPPRPTLAQVRLLSVMVSLVVVHSAAVALYVLGG